MNKATQTQTTQTKTNDNTTESTKLVFPPSRPFVPNALAGGNVA